MFKDFKGGDLSSLDVLFRHFSVDTEEEPETIDGIACRRLNAKA
jgi:hypothetical protein